MKRIPSLYLYIHSRVLGTLMFYEGNSLLIYIIVEQI